MQAREITVKMDHATETTIRRALSEHIDTLTDRARGDSGHARAAVFDIVLDGIGDGYLDPDAYCEDDVRDMITAVRARIEVADAQYRAALDAALMVLLRALA